MAHKNFFLVGFMGCGKSTFGKKLANKLGWDFVDMDDYIELKEGMSISEIFELKGETYFRDLETSVLKEFSLKSNNVISTGGGVPCFNNNMEVINGIGTSIYIMLPPKVLKDRLKNEKSKRPLIANLSDGQLLDFIENKLEERAPFYNKSSIVFDYLKTKESDFISSIS